MTACRTTASEGVDMGVRTSLTFHLTAMSPTSWGGCRSTAGVPEFDPHRGRDPGRGTRQRAASRSTWFLANTKCSSGNPESGALERRRSSTWGLWRGRTGSRTVHPRRWCANICMTSSLAEWHLELRSIRYIISATFFCIGGGLGVSYSPPLRVVNVQINKWQQHCGLLWLGGHEKHMASICKQYVRGTRTPLDVLRG